MSNYSNFSEHCEGGELIGDKFYKCPYQFNHDCIYLEKTDYKEHSKYHVKYKCMANESMKTELEKILEDSENVNR